MKKFAQKFVSILAALSIIVPASFAPLTAMAATFHTDGFESGGDLTGWTEVGSLWDEAGGAPTAHAGSRSAVVTNDTGATPDTITKIISTVGNQNIALNYWYRITSALGSNDHVLAQWSTDGSTWNTVADYTNVGTGAWTAASYSLPATAANNAGFRIRFSGNLDTSFGGDTDTFRLDDVTINGDALVPENTLARCTDGLDNDGDGNIDLLNPNYEPSCLVFFPHVALSLNIVGGSATAADFQLTLDGGAGSYTEPGPNDITVYPGSHTGSATFSVPNYTVTDCTVTSSATDPYDNDVCVVTATYNAPTGTLNIVKHVTSGSGSFDFTVYQGETAVLGANMSASSSQDGSTGPVSRTAGTYSITETIPGGWNLVSATCTDGESTLGTSHSTGVSGFNINSGANVTCTFTNSPTVSEPEPTGSIQITKYDCPADTVITRSANGVAVDDTVPAGCTTQSGVHFGYVHGTGTDANGPYDDVLGGAVTHVAGGMTNSSGVLTLSGLPATGRYLVYETDESNNKLADSEIMNLYCEGDGDTNDASHDNQELTFVTNGGIAKCVAYNVEMDAPVCSENADVIVVSDTGNNSVDEHSAVAVTPHEAWTSISGATWIWSQALDESGSSPVGSATFNSFFNISGTPLDSVIEIAADNDYLVNVNGTIVCSSIGDTNYGSVASCNIPAANLLTGPNQLTIVATNAPAPEGYTGPNPAGLLYKLTVNSQTCPDDGGGSGGDGDATRLRIKKETPNSYGEFNFTLAGTDETNINFSIETTYIADSDSQMFTIEPDTYTITEHVADGWELGTIMCEREDVVDDTPYAIANGGSVVLSEGAEILCTFVNTATTGFVNVTKEVINDDGEQEDADNFTIMVMRGGDVLGEEKGSEEGVIYAVSAGEYQVVEDPHGHYETEYSGECAGVIAVGEYKECTVINNDRDMTGGSGNDSSNNGSVLGASTETTTTNGTVLGAALSCSDLSYEQLITIKNGEGADPEIVKALQEWLNSSQNAGLAITGVYDQPTRFAVMLLQEKYASDTLTPWGLTKATGNVWQTTAKLIMKLVCGTNIEVGALVPFNS